jgi:hypothetical protein
MAPINHLTKRVSLELSTQPLSKAMIGAIAGGAIFIVLFVIGLGAFIYFYVKSSQRPDAAHLGPGASQQSSTVEVVQEKTLGDASSWDSSRRTSRPPPVQLKLVIDTPPASTTTSPDPNAIIPQPKKTYDRRSRRLGAPATGDSWNRQSLASNNSIDSGVPATPGNEFV